MSAIGQLFLGTVDTTAVTVTSTDNAVAADRTLDPDVISANGVARWEDRSVSVPAARPYVTLGMRKPSNGSRNYKVTALVGIPTLETLGTSSASGYLPGQKVGYTPWARIEFSLPDRTTVAERKAIFAAAASLFASTINAPDGAPSMNSGSPLKAMVANLETVY